MKSLTLLFAALFLSFMANAQKSINLTLEVEGVASQEGTLKIAIFNSESDWLENPVKKLYIKLGSEVNYQFVVNDLNPGKYAVSVIHDKNNNGELDMGMMGPTEAYGFSNNARGMFGPATFEEASLTLEKDRTEKINIK